MSDSMVTGSGSSSGGKSAGGSSEQNGSKAPVADVKELGGHLVSAARNGANSLYEEQRDRAAEEIAALGQALERSAQSLDGSIGETLAPYAQSAARQVGGFADTVRNRSLSQLGSDIEGFARQWPMAFMAASIGLGFVAGRFLLSSGASISEVISGNAGTQPSSGDRSQSGMPAQSGSAAASSGFHSPGSPGSGQTSPGQSTSRQSTSSQTTSGQSSSGQARNTAQGTGYSGTGYSGTGGPSTGASSSTTPSSSTSSSSTGSSSSNAGASRPGQGTKSGVEGH